MSSLPLHPSAFSLQPSAAAPPDAWLDLHECARRMGLVSNHVVRRFYVQKWAAAGLARKERMKDEGGRMNEEQWMVREDADARLAGKPRPPNPKSQEMPDLNRLTESQRSTLLAREAMVLDWQRLRATVGHGKLNDLTERFSAQRGVSRRSLYLWEQAYESHGRAGLADKRWRGDGEVRSTDTAVVYADYFRELEQWYCGPEIGQNQPSISSAIKLATRVARKNDWPIPHEAAARRHLRKLNAARITRGRRGADWFENACGAYIKRDYTKMVIDGVEGPMLTHDIWCADHHICDTIVRHEGKLIRPWLTCWEDLRSRKIVGYRFSPITPDSSAVLLALRHGILSNGRCVPRFCYTDNGRDFCAWFLTGLTKWERREGKIIHDQSLFKGVYARMQIKLWHAQPYNAKAKPVERFFGRYEDQFGKLTHTYCGRNPQEKPPHLEERLKRGQAQDFSSYVADATGYIEKCYHADAHLGQGMDGLSPNEIFAANLGELRILAPGADDACLAKTSRPVKVGRNGVVWEGRSYGQGEPALRPWFGKQVMLLVDPEDVARVSVYAPEGNKICDTSAVELMPFGACSEQRFKDAQAKVRRHNKALADVQKHGMRIVRSPVEILLDEHLSPRKPEVGNQKPEIPPPTIKMIQTGLEAPSNHDREPIEQDAAESVFDKLLRTDRIPIRRHQEAQADPWDKATRMREAVNG